MTESWTELHEERNALRDRVEELTQQAKTLATANYDNQCELQEQLSAMTQERDNWKQKALGNIKWDQDSCPFVEVCHRVD